MADQEPTYDDLRAELDRVDEELTELDADIREVRDSLNDSGPMDPEDRSAILQQTEELGTIRARLRRRRERLVEELGAAG